MKVTTFYRNSKGNYASTRDRSEGHPVEVRKVLLVKGVNPTTGCSDLNGPTYRS